MSTPGLFEKVDDALRRIPILGGLVNAILGKSGKQPANVRKALNVLIRNMRELDIQVRRVQKAREECDKQLALHGRRMDVIKAAEDEAKKKLEDAADAKLDAERHSRS